MGKEIRRYTINEMSTVLDVTDLCKGIYFLKIETKNGTVTKRFLKE
ncbi:MAG: T9SS type A sorting domain-containing protein [Bacteroidales bacterium]|nr:T9SS type A sorting domain-containing protein [Bacteroidales bacterium]MDD4210414.1 T9SS type A sorting domain-containing protein [Bacteroidales bacterium]